MYWLNDPILLFKNWNLFKKGLTRDQQYNTIALYIIIFFSVLAVINMNIDYITIGIIGLIVLTLLYMVMSGKYKQEIIDTPQHIKPHPIDTTNNVITSCNPYGNPGPYAPVCLSPIGCMNIPIEGDQFIDKLYNGPEMNAPGRMFNRIPDTTFQAYAPYPTTSVGPQCGDTGNIQHIGMRYT